MILMVKGKFIIARMNNRNENDSRSYSISGLPRCVLRSTDDKYDGGTAPCAAATLCAATAAAAACAPCAALLRAAAAGGAGAAAGVSGRPSQYSRLASGCGP